jgi:hypothetical protein
MENMRARAESLYRGPAKFPVDRDPAVGKAYSAGEIRLGGRPVKPCSR